MAELVIMLVIGAKGPHDPRADQSIATLTTVALSIAAHEISVTPLTNLNICGKACRRRCDSSENHRHCRMSTILTAWLMQAPNIFLTTVNTIQ